ncbi:MAG: GntR family transcriptional regulator, partial [Fibrella sp.]|nr:GntR family transcriptional regulator [Armatimonadota bacterium]
MVSQLTKKKVKADQTVYAYQRVEQDLRDKVRDGRLPAGSMLAGRHNLAREYGVSLATAQQAISHLIADGTLEAADRRGTFVAHRHTPMTNDALLRIPSVHSSEPSVASEEWSRSSSPRQPSRSVGTLGIVATSRIRAIDSSDDTGSIWARQGIRSLEQVFSVAGGATRFFDRYPEHLGPYERGIDDSNAISMTDAIAALCAEGVSALAIVGLCDGKDMSDEIVAAVDIDQIPVVYVSWHEMRPPLAQVYYDNKFAGYQAAQHLLRRGYSRLLFLAPFGEGWLAERVSGAQDAVRHAGLPSDALQVYP